MKTKIIAYIIISFTVLFAFTVLWLFLFKTTPINTSYPISTKIFADYGAIVGGISASLLSLASVLLIIQSIKEQEKTRILENIESRFFNLLTFVRENSENVSSKGKSGRLVFVKINKEFNHLFNHIKDCYTLKRSGVSKEEWHNNLIAITYLIIFFGVDAVHYEFLSNHLRAIIKNDNAWDTLEKDIIIDLKRQHNETKEKNKRLTAETREYLRYDGYQNILGHYFRHIFQTVKFIDKHNDLKYREKYNYIKILRAQLSSFEQVLFFYNSLSPFGRAWELSDKIHNENDKLVTKYNLVKNITFKLNHVIDISDFYPQVTYEGSNKTKERIELERKYS